MDREDLFEEEDVSRVSFFGEPFARERYVTRVWRAYLRASGVRGLLAEDETEASIERKRRTEMELTLAEEILKLLGQGPATLGQLSERGLSNQRQAGSVLVRLIKAGRIERSGRDKKFVYRLAGTPEPAAEAELEKQLAYHEREVTRLRAAIAAGRAA